jgi:hypothetical protein
MHELLAKKDGTLSGLLFNRTFEVSPLYGSQEEYKCFLKNAFD